MYNNTPNHTFFISRATDKIEFAHPLYHTVLIIKMIYLIIDGIKFNIQDRNAEWSTHQAAIADIVPDVIASIITEYHFGTVRVIPEFAAERCMLELSVIHKRHSLIIDSEYKTNTLVCLRYDRSCTPMIGCDTRYLFEFSDYIEFVLSGYNSRVFDEIFDLIADSSRDDDDKYTPCCTDGDARSLSEHLLNKLRSRILGGLS
jgi:hypothetical protein